MPTTEWTIEATGGATNGLDNAYPTRDAFLEADLLPTVTRAAFVVGGQSFAVIRHESGTIVQDNGQLWAPDGPSTPQHFGWEPGADAGPAGSLALRWECGENNLGALKEGAVYFPAVNGGYVFNTPMTVGTFQTTARVNVKIYGDGVSSFLVGMNTTGVLGITSNSRAMAFEVCDLWLSPEIAGAGYGISIVGNEGGTQGHATVNIHDVTLTARPFIGNGWWNAPLVATGWNRPKINNVVHFNADAAVVDVSRFAICNMNGCYKPHVTNNYFNGIADFGWINERVETQEGGYLVGNTFNGAKVGVRRSQPNRGPEFWFVDNHVNAIEIGVDFNGGKYAVFRGNLMYSQNGSTADFIYFKITGADNFEVTGNTYRSGATAVNTSARHVVLDDCRAFKIDETGLAARTTVPAFLIKANCSNGQYRLPTAVTATDSASYTFPLIEIESGATNIVNIIGWRDLGLYMPTIADCDAPADLRFAVDTYNTGSSSVNGPANVTVGHLTTTSRTASTGLVQTMVVEQPLAMRGWVFTRGKQSGDWSAWLLQQPVASGNTANRPANAVAGQSYLDTTLTKPVWYTGTVWIDATGATV